MSTNGPPEWEFSDRDVLVLRELAADPQLSSRELATVLEDEHGICVSHVTVSESIRKMREAGVFRESVVPNEAYFTFSLFEFKVDPSSFADAWGETMDGIREDPHTLFFFFTGGEYQWKSVMTFSSRGDESRWIREFYEAHGDAVENLRNSTVHDVFKFRTDPEMFTELGET